MNPLTEGRNSEQIRHRHDLRGLSGDTIADLLEVAKAWDASAEYCDGAGNLELAARDRRFATAMRVAADILSRI